MRALDVTATQVVTVGRLARYLKAKLERDPKLALLGVEGEVSNLRRQANGHVYFALKDRDGLMECVGWSMNAGAFPPFDNGTQVVAYGAVTTYAPRSVYQLDVKAIELAGVGKLHARYEELKSRLGAEGLFATARKRALPRYPFRVALVGSPTGEGTRDFLTQAAKRAPHVRVELIAAAVQGDAAAPDLVRAIGEASRRDVDLVVIARGGGSFEDLFVFSHESVVRAIAASRVPTVSAIGHEGDSPLSDYVADHRAPTPSTAAQTVLPARHDLARLVATQGAALQRAQLTRLERLRRALDRVEHRTPLADPARLFAAPRQRVDRTAAAIARALERRVQRDQARVVTIARRLEAASPRAWLAARNERLAGLLRRLVVAGPRIVAARRDGVRVRARRLERDDPARRLPAAQRRLDDRAVGLGEAVRAAFKRREGRLRLAGAELKRFDPEAPLQRGYAIVELTDGTVVRDPADAPPGTRVRAKLAHGVLEARVERSGSHGGEQIGLF